MDAVAIWSEYGAIGVCIALLGFTQVFLQRTLVGHLNELSEKLDNLYDITCKLIEKHNTSDANEVRRWEKLIEEMNDISDGVKFLQGKLSK